MTARTITVESPTEITLKAGDASAWEQGARAAMRLSPDHILVSEVSDDPQRTAEFLASIEAQTNKPE